MRFPKFTLPRVTLPRLPTQLIVFSIGLIAFCLGAYFIWPPLAPLALGAILMAISLFGGSNAL